MFTPYEGLTSVLNFDLEVVAQLLESDGSEYPYLSKCLRQRGAAKGQRLMQLLREALAYDTSIPGNPPNIDGGGYAYVKLPRERLRAKHGGSPSTWNDAINLFCAIGFMIQHKPGNHSPENNTAAENYSVDVAEGKGNHSRPATWYTFPRYRAEVLSEAERRAEALKRTPAQKDAIRDAIGSDIANMATDTAYNIHPETEKQRETLRKAALARLDAYGYFYPADVLNDALSASDAIQAAEAAKEAEDMFTTDPETEKRIRDAKRERRHYEQTWKQYLTPHGLLEAEHLTQPHKPTAAEREAYHLSNGKYIVTRRQ